MKACQYPKRSFGERGLALIGVIGLLLVFLVFAGAMLGQLANEVNSTKMATVSNRALAAADAGVHAMAEQIQYDLANHIALPNSSTPITYKYPEPGASPSAEQYSVTLDAVYPTSALNYYQITSTGTYNNGFETITRQVRALARAIPLSSMLIGSIYEVNKWGYPVWYLNSQHFNGPVYSGGPMRIAYATPAPSPAPTVDPIFGSTVQTPNQPVWSPCDPKTCGNWSSVIAGGSSAFTINNTPLSLPQPSDNIYVASEAWEGDGSNLFSGGFPSVSPGVYIDGATSGGKDAANSSMPVDTTGIYVNAGSSGTATITSTVSGNTDTLTINGPGFGSPYTVTINYSSFSTTGDCTGTTTVTHGTASHTFSGTPCGELGPGVTNPGNGAIFTYGNVQFGTGAKPDTTLEGIYSFVTPDYSGNTNTIYLRGNMQYDPASANFDKAALWANDVTLNSNYTTGLTIDAAIIAGFPKEPWSDGTFSNIKCTKTGCGTGSQGQLTINGSLVENAHGAVGEVIGNLQFGFDRVMSYDSRFATSPPPFNPDTGGLTIVAWEDLGT